MTVRFQESGAAMTEPLLEIDRLVKRFPVGSARLGRRPRAQVHAVDQVSFKIVPGETVGLVGESGCGKSTLVRLIARLTDPTAGTIRFAGADIGAIPARRFSGSLWRRGIQMVFQDAGDSFDPRYPAAAVIAEPLQRLLGMRGDRLNDRIRELAGMCGLPAELLNRFPHQLSGGQKARVGIARAIAVEPRLLILDEPTAALDVSVQVVILKLLDQLKTQLGMSYLFVSHDLNVVRLLCDRVLVMYGGRLVEKGTADTVLARPGHPYTRALLDSVPTAEVPDENRPPPLGGEPASPIDPDPNTCRFYGRCPKGGGRCKWLMPELLPIAPGHSVACHFPEPTAEARLDPGSTPALVPAMASAMVEV